MKAAALAMAAALCAACPGPGPDPTPTSGDDVKAALLAAVDGCSALPGVTPYSTDEGEPATITPCALSGGGAIAWQSDIDVDCDGGKQASCTVDPAYQPETSTTTSADEPLDANTLPYVVVPLPGHGFDYTEHDLLLGNAAYVIFGGKIVAGVFGDEGPPDIIGEASFAMCEALGVDANPVTGGADSGATFIVFSGSEAQVDPIEDHDVAERVALARARVLLGR